MLFIECFYFANVIVFSIILFVLIVVATVALKEDAVWDQETIKHGLHQALNQLVVMRGENFATEVASIVWKNEESGRVEWYLKNNKNSQPGDYVQRVTHYYTELYSYVYSLQVVKEEIVWTILYPKLFGWAKSILSKYRQGYDNLYEITQDVTQKTFITIVEATFPYDTDFDPWAYLVVRNIALGHSHLGTSCKESAENSLEVIDFKLHQLGSSVEEQIIKENEIKALHEAIACLPYKQRQFIELFYLELRSYQEIAEITGSKSNTLYKLHFDALKTLGKILSA